ncbi:bis(5'-nucleosyl)-tetraphosphatase (symmetrical) YqeK [Natroniella acetigena]|uniref:bis(5'-nucleosyl)-tetraphosphatase (symmetrical) YqeK n=1 Tax=Natroniella acetigena TaxID=52004 RepID=UPI00200B3052|nr:bis(5'-nucleosyl)-tetraphosphatase (symmetrical) YqeK [Natroniella acetigena]
MLTEEEAIDKLATLVDQDRLQHSLGVRDTAVKLAKNYNCNSEQAKWAGLIHDCAKGLSSNNLLKKAEQFDIVIDGVSRQIPELLHAPVGAELAIREFGIEDESILNAISLHTLGSEDMGQLAKIVFLADYIEPNRTCQPIRKLRKQVEDKELDQLVRIACENTIRYNLKNGKIVHPQTIKTRNSLL